MPSGFAVGKKNRVCHRVHVWAQDVKGYKLFIGILRIYRINANVSLKRRLFIVIHEYHRNLIWKRSIVSTLIRLPIVSKCHAYNWHLLSRLLVQFCLEFVNFAHHLIAGSNSVMCTEESIYLIEDDFIRLHCSMCSFATLLLRMSVACVLSSCWCGCWSLGGWR